MMGQYVVAMCTGRRKFLGAGQGVKDGICRVTPQKSDSPKFYIVQHQGTSAQDIKEFLLPILKPLIKAMTKS